MFAGTSTISRVVVAVCSLVQVPIALGHLGKEAFGLWMTLTGAVTFLAAADLGIGLGIQNQISEAHGKDDMPLARRVFFTGAAAVGCIGMVLLCVGLPLCFLLDWAAIFKIQDPGVAAQTGSALAIVAGAFFVGLPFVSAQRLATGFQLGWLSNLWLVAGAVLTLACIVAAKLLHLSLLPFLAIVVWAPILTNIGLLTHLMFRFGWWGCRFDFAADRLRELLHTGVLFLLPQIGANIIFLGPPLVISTVLGASAVTPYNLAQRLLAIIGQAQSLAMGAVWPAYAEAKARGDHDWIRGAFKWSLVFSSVIAIAPSALFTVYGRSIILLWTKKPDALPSQAIITLLAMWVAATALAQPCALLLNGMGKLKGQSAYGLFASLLAGALMPLFAGPYGVPGVILGVLLPFCLISLPLVYWEAFYWLRRLPKTTSPG